MPVCAVLQRYLLLQHATGRATPGFKAAGTLSTSAPGLARTDLHVRVRPRHLAHQPLERAEVHQGREARTDFTDFFLQRE